MQAKDIDTSKIYGYGDNWGRRIPVRVLATVPYKPGQNGGPYEPVQAGQRTRPGYYGRKLVGGYPAVRGSRGVSDDAALEAMREVTLEQAVTGSLPPQLQLLLLETARDVHAEEFVTWRDRRAAESRARADAERLRDAREKAGHEAFDVLRRELDAAGGFGVGTETYLSVGHSGSVTLTTSPELAERLAALIGTGRSYE